MFYSLLLQTMTSVFNWERVCIAGGARGGEKVRCAPPTDSQSKTGLEKNIFWTVLHSNIQKHKFYRTCNIFISNKTKINTLFTEGQMYADKVFQIVSPKIYHVTQRHPLTMGGTTRWLQNVTVFFPKQNRRLKRKPMHDTLALEWLSFSRHV